MNCEKEGCCGENCSIVEISQKLLDKATELATMDTKGMSPDNLSLLRSNLKTVKEILDDVCSDVCTDENCCKSTEV